MYIYQLIDAKNGFKVQTGYDQWKMFILNIFLFQFTNCAETLRQIAAITHNLLMDKLH